MVVIGLGKSCMTQVSLIKVWKGYWGGHGPGLPQDALVCPEMHELIAFAVVLSGSCLTKEE